MVRIVALEGRLGGGRGEGRGGEALAPVRLIGLIETNARLLKL